MGIFTLILSGLLLALGYKIVNDLDLMRVIHNQYPGKCSHIDGIETGSEDLVILPDGVTFISTGALLKAPFSLFKGYKGGILLYDASNPDSKIIPATIIGLKSDQFNPAGLSVHVDEKGTITLFAVNTFNDNVCKFVFNRDKNELTLSQTISSEKFTGINNIIAVDQNRFYVSNFVNFPNKILASIEVALQLPLANVIFFDGKTSSVILDGLKGANGLALSLDKKYLYTAEFLAKRILVHKIVDRDSKLKKVLDVPLYSSPDNINMDQNGHLWIATQPLQYQALMHVMEPKKFSAASQVLRVKFTSDHKSYDLQQVFADNGHQLAASTTAMKYRNKLLIGTLYHKLMQCEMNFD